MKVRLISLPPAGFGRDEFWEKSIAVYPYLGQEGEVLEVEDSAYDAEYPTGYETVYNLIQFPDGKKVWVGEAYFCGDDANGREVWHRCLKTCPDEVKKGV